MTRVSNSSIVATMNSNLNRSLYEVTRIQTKLSTGKNINRPGEDPIGFNRIMSLKTSIGENKQFIRNAEDAFSWSQSTELALADITNSLQRVRELAMKVGSGTLEENAKEALANEINQIGEHIFSLANTSYEGDRYLFGGHKNATPPFSKDAEGNVVYNGNNGTLKYDIARGISIDANINGQEAFMDINIFDIVSELSDNVRSGDFAAVNQSLKEIDQALDVNIRLRSVAGARMNRMDMATQRYLDEDLNLRTLLSQTEDVNMAEALMNYAMRENTYQAALSVAARAMQPTLLDFI